MQALIAELNVDSPPHGMWKYDIVNIIIKYYLLINKNECVCVCLYVQD
jgi:hypothetical protein